MAKTKHTPPDDSCPKARYKLCLTIHRKVPLPLGAINLYGVGAALIEEGLVPDDPEEVIIEIRQKVSKGSYGKSQNYTSIEVYEL